MRLSQLVEVIANNEECVVLKVKENNGLNLIVLGCFDGNEKMFRITKGKVHTATIFTEEGQFSWYWGYSGYTLVSDKIRKCGRLIQECVQEDFGIYIGDNPVKIKQTLNIQTLEDKKNKEHKLEIMWWPGNENSYCNIHKDGEFFKGMESVTQARNYISNHFHIHSKELNTGNNGCKIEKYQVVS